MKKPTSILQQLLLICKTFFSGIMCFISHLERGSTLGCTAYCGDQNCSLSCLKKRTSRKWWKGVNRWKPEWRKAYSTSSITRQLPPEKEWKRKMQCSILQEEVRSLGCRGILWPKTQTRKWTCDTLSSLFLGHALWHHSQRQVAYIKPCFFMATLLLASFASLALMRSLPSNPLRCKSWTLKVNCVTQTVRDIMPLWIGRHSHYSLYQYYTFPVLLFIKKARFSHIMLHQQNVTSLEYPMAVIFDFTNSWVSSTSLLSLTSIKGFPYPQVKRKHTLTKGEKQGGNTKPPISLFSSHIPLLGPEIDLTGKPMTHA